MYSTPRKSGNQRYSTNTPGSGGLRNDGLFEDGNWFCNCNPRLPAPCLQVKKDSGNKGRWFYTCPKERKAQCNFFLWKDAAETREKKHLMFSNNNNNNSASTNSRQTTGVIGRTTPPLPDLDATPTRARARQGMFSGVPYGGGEGGCGGGETGNTLTRSFPSSSSGDSGAAAATTTGKRKHIKIEDENEDGDTTPWNSAEHDYGDMNPEDESQNQAQGQSNLFALRSSQMAGISGNNSNSRDDPFAYTTPQARRAHDMVGGMTTPVSITRNTLLVASERRGDDAAAAAPISPSKKQKTGNGSGNGTPRSQPLIHTYMQTLNTPAAAQASLSSGGGGAAAAVDSVNTNMTTTTGDTAHNDDGTNDNDNDGDGSISSSAAAHRPESYDVTEYVLGLLRGQAVDKPVRDEIRSFLDTYALRARGLESGRDMARASLRAREARVAELQERVALLERERQEQRALYRRLNAQMMALSQGGEED